VVRARQNLGKYRVQKRIAEGGFAAVYRAVDTIEGVPVALKIPHEHFMNKKSLEEFRKEVRVTAKLDHPNILTIKNASFIDGTFVIVYPLGECTLYDRLRKRMSLRTALEFTEQMLEAVAFAHSKRIMHLDIKPENFIIFKENRLRLADFGIAKIAHKTVQASGAGTVGYIAPEQAMGKPSQRSDVFSLGLIIYRMFSGELPEWPFEWPPPGFKKLKKNLHPQMIAIIRRALAIDHRSRFADAGKMLAAFDRVKSKALSRTANGRTSQSSVSRKTQSRWQTVRVREFLKLFKTSLDVRCTCEHCGDPVSETMQHCPWCGVKREQHHDDSSFPAECPRCRRGVKLDWEYCAWCFGQKIGPVDNRQYTDKRYVAKCSNPACERKLLMPFMKYCPWCRTKVKKKWAIPGTNERCDSCEWGVLREFWDFCPWCGKSLR
jgi:eukaryotic-like serine/threonine-protein kinase